MTARAFLYATLQYVSNPGRAERHVEGKNQGAASRAIRLCVPRTLSGVVISAPRTPSGYPSPRASTTLICPLSTTTMSADIKSDKPAAVRRRSSSPTRPQPTSDIDELHARLHADPRFNPPTPSPWKRAALLVFAIALFYFAVTMRQSMRAAKREPEVVYAQRYAVPCSQAAGGLTTADRYSNEHKFRPAASPIITERLPDGRLKVRGAQPTHR